MKIFGEERVLEPKGFFPVSAWQLDNKREIKDTELRTEILNEKTKNKEYMKNIEDIEKKIEQYKKSGTSG